MNAPDPEFEDFLRRRGPLFRRGADDGLEPPAELDRVVLRQAREAIQEDRPQRLFRLPSLAVPLAVAATLVLGLAVVFQAGLRDDTRVPAVTVESVQPAAQRQDTAPPALPQPSPASNLAQPVDGAIVVDLAPTPGALPAESAPWRRDPQSWQAEIQRLRTLGEGARADAEQAEYNRQQRAFAASPDR